jgi:hypothetical protein
LREREAKLVIRDARPAAVADAVAALEDLAGCRLVPAGDLLLRDVYLDTPTRALSERGDGLRVREAGGQTLLALKGSSREVDPGVLEREEIETPGPAPRSTGCGPSWRRAASRFARRRRRGSPSPRCGPWGSRCCRSGPPTGACGTRWTRAVFRLAELAIDAVTYRLDAGAIRHHEVEIESKSPSGAAYLSARRRGAPRALRRLAGAWRHGKLSIGLAIARLLAAGDARALVAGGHLVPDAYARLAALLSDEPAPPGSR